MAELLALATAAAGVVALAKTLAGSPKQPLYTLTPPVFDRASHASEENGLTLTPLERFAYPRSRLLSRHFTDADCLLDARLHMAPPVAIDGGRVSHDFMARISVPQPALGQPGAPRAAAMRPQATARFHLQHPDCAHSFTDFVLKTEGGGSIFATGAYNLTAAKARFDSPTPNDAAPAVAPAATQQQRGGVPVAVANPTLAAASVAARRARSLHEGPRGLSAFFNLPLFGLGSQLQPRPQEAEGEGAEGVRARSKYVLRSTPRIGLRWDEPWMAGQGSAFSAGVHLDPQASLHQLRDNQASQVQVGGWIAQETTNFRFAVESTIAPMQKAIPGAAAAAAPSVNVGASGSAASVLEGHAVAAPAVGPGSLVPPSLAARLPLLVESRFGLFFRDSPMLSSSSSSSPSSSFTVRPTVPSYEVGFSVLNRSPSLLHNHPSAVTQEFTASYFHHLNVRRRIHNPFEEKQNRYVNNYIDLAMEIVYRNYAPAGARPAAAQVQGGAAAAALAAAIPPSLRLGASWQLNKNCLVKARLADDSLAALVAVKSWWDPSASLALSVQHGLAARGRTTVGLSFEVENVGDALFLRPDPAYKRMVASQKERIENLVEVDEDY